jgi:hypothetical protein
LLFDEKEVEELFIWHSLMGWSWEINCSREVFPGYRMSHEFMRIWAWNRQSIFATRTSDLTQRANPWKKRLRKRLKRLKRPKRPKRPKRLKRPKWPKRPKQPKR